MPADVRAVWDYTVQQLDVMRLASPADRDALACYCEAVVTHRKASALVAKAGVLVSPSRGTVPVRNPALAAQRDAAILVRVYAREFGLTPSARSELTAGDRRDTAGSAARLLS
jgi:P27 family predicted phage terminase small subunit